MSAIVSERLDYPPFRLPPETEALREEVRAFLRAEVPKDRSEDRFKSWNTASPEFSRKMGAKGYIGVTWPKQYGGGEVPPRKPGAGKLKVIEDAPGSYVKVKASD